MHALRRHATVDDIALLESAIATYEYSGPDEIAGNLGMSTTAVRNHVANILVKLQLRSRIEAAILAVEGRPGGPDG